MKTISVLIQKKSYIKITNYYTNINSIKYIFEYLKRKLKQKKKY